MAKLDKSKPIVFFNSDSNCYSAQIEGSGITLRIGHRYWGLYPNDETILQLRRKQTRFVKWFPKIHIGINYHTGSKGIWCFISINSWGWYSKEEYHPGY